MQFQPSDTASRFSLISRSKQAERMRVCCGISEIVVQVEAMQLIPGVQVVAVAAGSSKEKAEDFAKNHGEADVLA